MPAPKPVATKHVTANEPLACTVKTIFCQYSTEFVDDHWRKQVVRLNRGAAKDTYLLLKETTDGSIVYDVVHGLPEMLPCSKACKCKGEGFWLSDRKTGSGFLLGNYGFVSTP